MVLKHFLGLSKRETGGLSQKRKRKKKEEIPTSCPVLLRRSVEKGRPNSKCEYDTRFKKQEWIIFPCFL
jgi:hypothetical protein